MSENININMLRELIESSESGDSSSDGEMSTYISGFLRQREKRTSYKNFVDEVVSNYTDKEVFFDNNKYLIYVLTYTFFSLRIIFV